MRNCLLFIALGAVSLHCVHTRTIPVTTGPLVLHVWIYYKSDPQELVKVVDSSHCKYTLLTERETDGMTRVEFSFVPDPNGKQMDALFRRLCRYKDARGYSTTRGTKINER